MACGVIRNGSADICSKVAASVTSSQRRPTLLTRRSTTMSTIEGELVTETFEYDSGRRVTSYVPPDPPEAVVFAGDGS
jgi:hypothetical protein